MQKLQTRRGVLKKGLFGSALLFLGGAGFLALRDSKTVPLPKDGLKVLDEVEYAVLFAIAQRVIPPRPGFPGTEVVNAAANADLVLLRTDEGSQKEIRQLLRLFESALANFAFGLRGTPFTQLSEGAQDEVLREWQHSRLEIRRTGFNALRTLVTASYYAAPETWGAVGYRGPPQGFHQKDAPEYRSGKRPPGNGAPPEDPRATNDPGFVPPEEVKEELRDAGH